MTTPPDDTAAVAAHVQQVTHRYWVHYPAHPARTSDPNYVDFEHIHAAWKADPTKWRCSIGAHRGDFSECDLTHPLELHHSHIEFALQNGVDLQWLEVDYPGISNPDQVGAWVESAQNLEVLCVFHHRGAGGAHTAAHADFVAEEYVRGLISAQPPAAA